MLIAVISDSHANRSSIEKVKKKISNTDILLFLGDGERDLEEITEGFNGEVYAVRGNCDIRGLYPEERVIEIQGKRIFMCHGHRYGVKYGYNSIFYRAKELDVDIVLFGHSHGIILMNPGSVSLGMSSPSKTLGYIELIEDKEPILYIKEV